MNGMRISIASSTPQCACTVSQDAIGSQWAWWTSTAKIDSARTEEISWKAKTKEAKTHKNTRRVTRKHSQKAQKEAVNDHKMESTLKVCTLVHTHAACKLRRQRIDPLAGTVHLQRSFSPSVSAQPEQPLSPLSATIES